MMGIKKSDQGPYMELFISLSPVQETAADDKPTMATTATTAVKDAARATTAVVKSGIINVKRKANVDRILRRFKDKKDDKEPPK